MADEPQDPGAAEPEPGDRTAEAAAQIVNSQIVDAVSMLTTLTVGEAPAASAGMVNLMTADALALGMLNAVARQQSDAMIAAASVAAACARMAGTGLPAVAAADVVPAAEAQAQAAILAIRTRAAGADGDAAKAALQRIADAARDAAGPAATKRERAARGDGR